MLLPLLWGRRGIWIEDGGEEGGEVEVDVGSYDRLEDVVVAVVDAVVVGRRWEEVWVALRGK